MAKDPLDCTVRSVVCRETNAVIDAHAAVSDRDRAEVIREVLDKWASGQLEIRRLIDERLKSEGG